jgi:hypothetical protein
LISVVLGSVALLHFAARSCQTTLFALARSVPRGLLLPVVACTTTAVGINHILHPGSWGGIVAVALGAGSVYTTWLYFSGAREEEREFFKEIMGLPVVIARAGYRQFRRVLRRAVGESRRNT